jgi:hypothetical protein
MGIKKNDSGALQGVQESVDVVELSELELAVVGGGSGEVVFH